MDLNEQLNIGKSSVHYSLCSLCSVVFVVLLKSLKKSNFEEWLIRFICQFCR